MRLTDWIFPLQGHPGVSRHLHVSCRWHYPLSPFYSSPVPRLGEASPASLRKARHHGYRTGNIRRKWIGQNARLTRARHDQVDAYPLYAASAIAANTFVRCTFAGECDTRAHAWLSRIPGGPRWNQVTNSGFWQLAAFPLFGVQMYEKLGYQWASSLLAFLTVAMLPFPFIFFRYGKRIRQRSRYAKA